MRYQIYSIEKQNQSTKFNLVKNFVYLKQFNDEINECLNKCSSGINIKVQLIAKREKKNFRFLLIRILIIPHMIVGLVFCLVLNTSLMFVFQFHFIYILITFVINN